jgi:hypothetical protein
VLRVPVRQAPEIVMLSNVPMFPQNIAIPIIFSQQPAHVLGSFGKPARPEQTPGSEQQKHAQTVASTWIAIRSVRSLARGKTFSHGLGHEETLILQSTSAKPQARCTRSAIGG